MPKYAMVEGGRVTRWYDTDGLSYPNLPPDLVQLTDAQWKEHMNDLSAVVIDSQGHVVRAHPPS